MVLAGELFSTGEIDSTEVFVYIASKQGVVCLRQLTVSLDIFFWLQNKSGFLMPIPEISHISGSL